MNRRVFLKSSFATLALPALESIAATTTSSALSATIEREAAVNLKRTWVNHSLARDWAGPAGEGRQFLQAATEIKTIWVPYGE